MEEYDKQFPAEDDALYDMYSYDDKYGAAQEGIEHGIDGEDYESDDDVFFFNSNDMANRIWNGCD